MKLPLIAGAAAAAALVQPTASASAARVPPCPARHFKAHNATASCLFDHDAGSLSLSLTDAAGAQHTVALPLRSTAPQAEAAVLHRGAALPEGAPIGVALDGTPFYSGTFGGGAYDALFPPPDASPPFTDASPTDCLVFTDRGTAADHYRTAPPCLYGDASRIYTLDGSGYGDFTAGFAAAGAGALIGYALDGHAMYVTALLLLLLLNLRAAAAAAATTSTTTTTTTTTLLLLLRPPRYHYC